MLYIEIDINGNVTIPIELATLFPNIVIDVDPDLGVIRIDYGGQDVTSQIDVVISLANSSGTSYYFDEVLNASVPNSVDFDWLTGCLTLTNPTTADMDYVLTMSILPAVKCFKILSSSTSILANFALNGDTFPFPNMVEFSQFNGSTPFLMPIKLSNIDWSITNDGEAIYIGGSAISMHSVWWDRWPHVAQKFILPSLSVTAFEEYIFVEYEVPVLVGEEWTLTRDISRASATAYNRILKHATERGGNIGYTLSYITTGDYQDTPVEYLEYIPHSAVVRTGLNTLPANWYWAIKTIDGWGLSPTLNILDLCPLLETMDIRSTYYSNIYSYYDHNTKILKFNGSGTATTYPFAELQLQGDNSTTVQACLDSLGKVTVYSDNYVTRTFSVKSDKIQCNLDPDIPLYTLYGETSHLVDVFEDGSCVALYTYDETTADEAGNYPDVSTPSSYVDGMFHKRARHVYGPDSPMPADNIMTHEGTFSISFWFNAIHDGSPYPNALFDLSPQGVPLRLYHASDLVYWYYGDSQQGVLASMNDGSNYHLTVTKDAGATGDVKVYNGTTLLKTWAGEPVTFRTYSTAKWLGSDGYGNPYNGYIEQLRIFNRVITTTEMLTLHYEKWDWPVGAYEWNYVFAAAAGSDYAADNYYVNKYHIGTFELWDETDMTTMDQTTRDGITSLWFPNPTEDTVRLADKIALLLNVVQVNCTLAGDNSWRLAMEQGLYDWYANTDNQIWKWGADYHTYITRAVGLITDDLFTFEKPRAIADLNVTVSPAAGGNGADMLALHTVAYRFAQIETQLPVQLKVLLGMKLETQAAIDTQGFYVWWDSEEDYTHCRLPNIDSVQPADLTNIPKLLHVAQWWASVTWIKNDAMDLTGKMPVRVKYHMEPHAANEQKVVTLQYLNEDDSDAGDLGVSVYTPFGVEGVNYVQN